MFNNLKDFNENKTNLRVLCYGISRKAILNFVKMILKNVKSPLDRESSEH